jgi:hypothetical protein
MNLCASSRSTIEKKGNQMSSKAHRKPVTAKETWASEWKERIEFAQAEKRILLRGTWYKRIPMHSETWWWPSAAKTVKKCPGCAVTKTQLHVVSCDFEQCPRCNKKLLICGCSRGSRMTRFS